VLEEKSRSRLYPKSWKAQALTTYQLEEVKLSLFEKLILRNGTLSMQN
jgi:hypothetical protein